MRAKPRLFLDTSALFSGIWSVESGARMLLRLGEIEMVQLLLSPQVLQEIEEVIRRKAPQSLPALAILLDRSRAEVVTAAPQNLVGHCLAWVPHAGDARIIADAWHNRADFLVTLDKAHFLNAPELRSQLPFPIGTPGDCLAGLRRWLGEI